MSWTKSTIHIDCSEPSSSVFVFSTLLLPADLGIQDRKMGNMWLSNLDIFNPYNTYNLLVYFYFTVYRYLQQKISLEFLRGNDKDV